MLQALKLYHHPQAVAVSLLLGAVLSSAAAADDAAGQYADIVAADRPAAYWRFEGADNTVRLANSAAGAGRATLAGEIQGDVQPAADGPRPGEFPLFGRDNQAIAFTGRSGYIRIADPGANSPLDFGAGETITLEAWVAPRELASGRYAYIVGKGRTDRPGVARDNQNYALRLHGQAGGAAISFVFHSAGPEGDWHRWTSNATMPVGDGWHHVAVSYTFGKKDSLRGYIDGEPVSGKWDMAGATDRPPIVDDDELWIGSSMGGNPSSTFHGLIDEVAVYRAALPAARVKARYQYVSPEPQFDAARLVANRVLVEIFEDIPDKTSWSFRPPRHTGSYVTEGFAFPDVPKKYSSRGVHVDRSSPFLVRAHGKVALPEGKLRLLVRCRNASRLFMDGRLMAETAFHSIDGNAHGQVWELDASLTPRIRPLRRGDTQTVVEIDGDGAEHLFRFEMIVGGRQHRPDFGETGVFVARQDEEFRLLSATWNVHLTDEEWLPFMTQHQALMAALNFEHRRSAGAEEDAYWNRRHAWARDELAKTPAPRPPDLAEGMPVHNDIDRYLGWKLQAAGEQPAELTDEFAFVRRVTLDVIGTIPTPQQLAEFLADNRPDRRSRLIDRLLEHPGWADHWVGYWQDVLAENPNIVNPTLNNTGPFRWWIHESFAENKPFDRFATELVLMEGSQYFGGPAGFAMATQNDVPMAAKAHILGEAFLAIEMKCARCHDAPFHDLKQRDLFSLAAMLNRGPLAVPETSSIPGGTDAAKSHFVEVTLLPGEQVPPAWAFQRLMPEAFPEGVLREPNDPRERLAALITLPGNRRFAQVIVNRMWQRYFGRGLVEPVDDWEHAEPSHPELLDYLARELVKGGYDLKHVARLMLNSHAYQRQPRGREAARGSGAYLFAAPLVRRMTAEQLVDSLFVVCGKEFDAGPMSVDIDGARAYTQSLDLGVPVRAWQFSSTSNERDRPSLALPFAQPFVTLLETFGWRSSRQDPLTVRETEPNVLQPGVLSNGELGRRIVRLSEDSAFTEMALRDQPLESLIEAVFVRVLSRPPSVAERAMCVDLLARGYESRRVENAKPAERPRLPRDMVSWSNHLHPRANEINLELEAAVRRGEPPTYRLQHDWRERMEDMLWALVNSPEFVFVP